jgi:transposase
MQAYPLAKRLAVLATYAAGEKTQEVAREHGVSRSWARRVKQRGHEPPGMLKFPRPRRREPRWTEHADQIEELMEKNPELTLRELKEALQTDLSVQTLCRALKHLRWSKNRPRGWRDRIEENDATAINLLRKVPSPPSLADRLEQLDSLSMIHGF